MASYALYVHFWGGDSAEPVVYDHITEVARCVIKSIAEPTVPRFVLFVAFGMR